MVMSRRQNAGQNHDVNTASRSFESLAKFSCLGTRVTNQNCFHEEMASRLNSENDFYHSVLKPLFCRLLSADIKIKICEVIFLLVFLDGCETWSLTLEEEHNI
jgi:hypothetical protein